MHLAAPPSPPLLTQLASLAQCTRAEGYACIRARHEHGAQSVDVDRPQLAILLQGRKQLRCDTSLLEFMPGDLLVMTRACRIDMLNAPDPHSGLYLSVVIPLCEEVLAAARMLWQEPLPVPGPALLRRPASQFSQLLLQWQQALRESHYAEARLALATLVIELCRQGHGGLLRPLAPSFAGEVRARIDAQPGRDWQSCDLEAALSVSGATLRRRLAAEGTTLRALLTQARLASAMELLYTTHLPLKTVAARVGYRSVASFCRRFQARYRMHPSAIGNAKPENAKPR